MLLRLSVICMQQLDNILTDSGRRAGLSAMYDVVVTQLYLKSLLLTFDAFSPIAVTAAYLLLY